MNRLLHHSIKKMSETNPDKIAIVFNDVEIRYKDVWEKIKQLSSRLAKDFHEGDRIGIVLDNSPELIFLLYAIPTSKLIAVPLDGFIHIKNLERIYDHCQLKAVISSKEIISKFPGNNSKVSFIDVDSIMNTTLNYSEITCDPSDTAIIMYTSGTSGLAKGVELSHFNLLSSAKNINSLMNIGEWAVETVPIPLCHSFGFGRIRCIFDVGGTVILEKGLLRPEKVIFNMKKYSSNGFCSVPSGFSIILDYYEKFFKEVSGSLKYIEICTSSMQLKHKLKLIEICPNTKIYYSYGLTEASRSAFIELNSEKKFIDSIGRPSPNVEIKIVDQNMHEIETNIEGELIIKGNMVMKGYLNDTEKTNTCLVGGWLKTGDIGKYDEHGYIQLIGREDDIINVGGLKVGPLEVEEVLKNYDGVEDCCVVGLKSDKDQFLNQIIKAYIVPIDKTFNLDFNLLKKYCLEYLEAYKIPKEFEIIDKIPKTDSGKIKRSLLRTRL